MHAAWLRPLLAVLCVGILLAGCGKGASTTSTGGGPLGQLAPTAAPGAVSVTTRNTTRLGGADAATDAAAVARTVYPGLTPATRPKAVVLVDQRNWPAALAASALAGAPTGAPILYSDGNSLPDVSGQALQALNPLGAPVLGGAPVRRIGTSAAVPKGYRTQSLSAGQPAVAAAGIERLLGRADGRAPRQVIVVPANATPALAMPAAGLSAESGAPILFVAKARALHRRAVRLGGQRTGSRPGVRQRRAPAGRSCRRLALGHRRLRAAAGAGKPRAAPARAGELPEGHPARLHRRVRLPARQGRLQSRLADRRRTRYLSGHTGRNRLPARDQPC